MTSALSPKDNREEKLSSFDSEHAPSQLLQETAVKIVARSLLRHSEPERREGFRHDLLEFMQSSEVNHKIALLAGLKEAGLSYKHQEDTLSIAMRMPRLSNPNPEEFSSAVNNAILRTGGAAELIREKGQELVSSPETKAQLSEWLENMEVAVRNIN